LAEQFRRLWSRPLPSNFSESQAARNRLDRNPDNPRDLVDAIRFSDAVAQAEADAANEEFLNDLFGAGGGGGGGGGGGRGGGGGGGSGAALAAIAQQEALITAQLQLTMANIAEQFSGLTAELERQKEVSGATIADARLRAVGELTGVSEEFEKRAAEGIQGAQEATDRARGAISADAAALLSDLEAQGASTAATQERLGEGRALLSQQGAIGERLAARLNEVSRSGLERQRGVAETVAQGSTGDLENNVAAALAQANAQRQQQEFEAQQGFLQAQLALAGSAARGGGGGGGGGRRGGGGGGGGGGGRFGPLFDSKDEFLISQLMSGGATMQEATFAVASGNANQAADQFLGLGAAFDPPSPSEQQFASRQAFIGQNPDVLAALGSEDRGARERAQGQVEAAGFATPRRRPRLRRPSFT
jgi:vacuolar-type H+-ATPase subunit H